MNHIYEHLIILTNIHSFIMSYFCGTLHLYFYGCMCINKVKFMVYEQLTSYRNTFLKGTVPTICKKLRKGYYIDLYLYATNVIFYT